MVTLASHADGVLEEPASALGLFKMVTNVGVEDGLGSDRTEKLLRFVLARNLRFGWCWVIGWEIFAVVHKTGEDAFIFTLVILGIRYEFVRVSLAFGIKLFTDVKYVLLYFIILLLPQL